MDFLGVASVRGHDGGNEGTLFEKNSVVWVVRVSLSRRIIVSNENSHQNALT